MIITICCLGLHVYCNPGLDVEQNSKIKPGKPQSNLDKET